MSNRLMLLVFTATILGCGAARADTLCYAGTSGASVVNPTSQSTTCTGSTALMANGGDTSGNPGTGATAGPSALNLTDFSAGNYGSVRSANSFAVGTSFSTSFDFQVAQIATYSSYGFAFVIGQANAFGQPSGSTSNPGYTLGIGSAPSVDVLFGTRANYQTGNPNLGTNGVVNLGPAYTETTKGKILYSDNYIGVVQNGQTLSTPNGNPIPTSAPVNSNYGIVSACSNSHGSCVSNTTPGYYNNGTFVSGSKDGLYAGNNTLPGICDQPAQLATAGCMNNKDVWSAKITITNGVLTVSLVDLGNGQAIANNIPATVFSYTLTQSEQNILAQNNLDIGFTSAGGAQYYEQVNILNWAASSNAVAPVPEPAAAAMLGAGLIGLGMVRRKRAA